MKIGKGLQEAGAKCLEVIGTTNLAVAYHEAGTSG
jgi:hypothetical protein